MSKGVFEGVSSVPFEKNQCNKDSEQFKPAIIDAFTGLYNAFKTRTNIVEALMKFYALFQEIQSLEANCHYKTLATELATVATKIGLAKVVYRIVTHPTTILQLITETVQAIKNGDSHIAGIAFGQLVKVSLNYSTI